MHDEQKLPAPPRDAVFAYYPIEGVRREDEIRLVDLWLVLVRRRLLFFTIAGLILALGLAYALLAPPKYRYSALIELGSIPTANGPRAVEGVQTVLAKVNGAFLPAVLGEYLQDQPEGTSPPEIRASVPRGSETLMLAAEAPVDEGPTLIQLQEAVIARLAQDHAALVDTARRAISVNIVAARNQQETLAANGRKLAAQFERVNGRMTQVREERSEIARHLEDARALERQLSKADGGARDTIAILQAGVESRALRDQLLALDERLSVAFPKQLDDLQAAIEANDREMVSQAERIAKLEADLGAVRDTRAIQPPTESLEESGPGTKAIVVLAGLLGLFFGIVAAFGAEFVSNLRTATEKALTTPDGTVPTD